MGTDMHIQEETTPQSSKQTSKIRSGIVSILDIVLIVLTLICLSVDAYWIYKEITPPGISIDYDGVSEGTYQEKIDTVLSNFPDTVIESANKTGLEIHMVSGKGTTVVDVEEYLYSELGLEAPTNVLGNTKSTMNTGNPESYDNLPIIGCYLFNKNSIYIFVDNLEAEKEKGYKFEQTLNHEIGHYIWYHVLTDKDREDMESYFSSEEVVKFGIYMKNIYCAANVHEYFAEFIEYYLRPEYDGTEGDWGTPNTLSLVSQVFEDKQ